MEIFTVGGLVAVVVSTYGLRRAATSRQGFKLDARGLAAALAVGVAVGFAQAVPLMLMPVVFQYPMGTGSGSRCC